MIKLTISPDATGYSFADGSSVISTKLDGGLSRYRADVLNPSSILNVQWTLDDDEYYYMRWFFTDQTMGGALPFMIDLLINDGSNFAESECYFVPGSFTLKSTNGKTFIVSASLEIKQPIFVFNPLILLFGSQWEKYNNTFNAIINVDLPRIMK